MSQFAGDDTMSILDSINDGKHVVPLDTEPKPAMGRKKLFAFVWRLWFWLLRSIFLQ